MPKPGFKFCALHYLNLWISQDRAYCKALAGHDRKKKLQALAGAAVSYGVARTLRTSPEESGKPHRYRPVLAIIDAQNHNDFKGSMLPQSLQKVRKKIRRKNGNQDVLSLTTKFLWLKIKSPIIIYDSRAKTALAVELDTTPRKIREYDAYCLGWRKMFKKYAPKIKAACRSLPKAHEYVVNPAITTRQYIAKIAAKQWFQERVFDVYLWHLGSKA